MARNDNRQAGQRVVKVTPREMQQIVERTAMKHGPLHPETVRLQNQLVGVLVSSGHMEEAAATQQKVVGALTRKLGPAHDDTLRHSLRLAQLLEKCAGKGQIALHLYERVLASVIAQFGPTSDEALLNRSRLGLLLVGSGQERRGVELMEAARRDAMDAALASEATDDLLTELAAWYRANGKPDAAVPVQDDLIRVRLQCFGPNDVRTLVARNDLGISLADAGRLDEAVRTLDAVVADEVAALGESSPHTLRSMSNLAVSLGRAGRTDDGIALLRKVLALRQAALGADHQETFLSVTFLTNALKESGQLEEAGRIAAEALPRFLESWRTVDERSWGIATDLTDTLEACDPEAALQVRLRLVVLITRVAGEHNPITFNARYSLATLLGETHRPHEAIDGLQRLLADVSLHMANDSGLVLSLRRSLAKQLMVVGRPADALSLLEAIVRDGRIEHPSEGSVGAAVLEQLDECRRLLAPRQFAAPAGSPRSFAPPTGPPAAPGPATAVPPPPPPAADLGRPTSPPPPPGPPAPVGPVVDAPLVTSRGSAATSIAAARLEFDTLRRTLGAGHPHTMVAHGVLVEALAAAGRPADAAAELVELLRWQATTLGLNDPSTTASVGRLAELAGEGRAWDVTLGALRAVLTEHAAAAGGDTDDVLSLRMVLAQLCWDADRVHEAIASGSALLDDLRRLHGSADPRSCEVAILLMRWHNSRGQPQLAATLGERHAIDCVMAVGPDHEQTLRVRKELGFIWTESGRPGAAAELLSDVIERARRVLGEDADLTLDAQIALGQALGEDGRAEAAVATLEAVLPALRRIRGELDVDTCLARANLALWRGRSGRRDEALRDYDELVPSLVRQFGPHHELTTLVAANRSTAATNRINRRMEELAAQMQQPKKRPQHMSSARAKDRYDEAVMRRGPFDHHALQCRNELALALQREGRNAEAAAEDEALLRALIRVVGPHHVLSKAVRSRIDGRTTGDGGADPSALGRPEAVEASPDELARAQRNRLRPWRARRDRLVVPNLSDDEKVAAFTKELLTKQALWYPPDHPIVMMNRFTLGNRLRLLDRTEESMRQFEQLLPDQIRALGPTHPRTMATWGWLTALYLVTGDGMAAERSVRHALAHEPDDATPSSADSTWYELRQLLIDALDAQGRTGEAVVTAEELVGWSADRTGSESSFTTEAQVRLAAQYSRAGRTDEAVLLFAEALPRLDASAARMLALRAAGHYAAALVDVGRAEEAVAVVDRAVTQAMESEGADDPLTLELRLGQNTTAVHADPSSVQVDTTRALVADCHRALGEAHAVTLAASNNLAMVQLFQGDTDGAFDTMTAVIRVTTELQGEDSPITLSLMANTSAILLRADQPAAAVRLLESTVERQTAVLGARHPDTMRNRAVLGDLLPVLGRYDDARVVLRELLADQEALFGSQHPRTQATRRDLEDLDPLT